MSLNKYDKLISVCSDLLDSPSGSLYKEYLNNRLNVNTQKLFNFGYFPEPANLNILFTYLSDQELIETELLDKNNLSESGVQTYYSPMQHHNLIMPYRDVYGKIIAIVGRTRFNDQERNALGIPKYKNTSFKKNKHLFGLFEAKKSIIKQGYVYVVEGQFDVIKAHEKGIKNIVALGTSNMSMEQLILLLRYTNNINLLLDNDEAGQSGRDKILERLGKYNKFRQCYIPKGYKDMDEFLSEADIRDDQELLKIVSAP